jgi:hypothetical protein
MPEYFKTIQFIMQVLQKTPDGMPSGSFDQLLLVVWMCMLRNSKTGEA